MRVPDSHPDFPNLEERVLKWWDEKDISKKYRAKNNSSDKKYRFLDGPITANNPMGVHHAHGRTVKDFFQRFKNMQGYKQRFQNGFDCQGLWVEVEEEKDLGFDSKRDIEEYGLDNFSNSCRARVNRFSKVQSDQSARLGMFMNWDDSYYTMSETNNLHIWHFLKTVNEKGWLYKGVDAMPWCTRCGTAISQHELSDGGYKDVTHESVYVKFPLTTHANDILATKYSLNLDLSIKLLVWTTTPWTLLANVAVALNPTLDYLIVEQEGEYLILVENRREVLEDSGTVVAKVKGKELSDLFSVLQMNIYQGPFDELDLPSQVSHRLIEWDEVSEDDGTGLVHIAPGAGKEDFELHRELDIDLLTPIDEFGDYLPGYGDYSGLNVHKVRGKVVKELQEKNLLYKTENIHHSYPHCWRCKHELVFRTTSEWFIRADEIRPLMKEASAKVNWMPEHAGKRMQDWLDNMGDWPISRKRYWGLALPFFESEDGKEYYVVGSKEELRELAIEPEKVDQLQELHRPWVDEIKIKSPETGNILTRVTDVGDCWLDAGIVPFSTVDYLGNHEHWEDWFPFDFITEYVAQVKLWFYATLFMSVTLIGRAPWKNVLATGFLVDEKGDAMHKSRGNAISFDEAAERAGADAIRWLYLRERVANYHGTGNLRFGYTILDEVRRRFFVILWNTYRFFVQNALLDNWSVEEIDKQDKDFVSENILDRWIISRLNEIIKTSTESLEKYDSTVASNEIERFVVNDLSQWYIRRSRERVGPTVPDSDDKRGFYTTTYEVLSKITRLMAPFTPFLSEEIFSNLRAVSDPISVHLTEWPRYDETRIDVELNTAMQILREDAEKMHSVRKQEGIPLRQPLSSAQISKLPGFSEELIPVLESELNIWKIVELDNESEIKNQKERESDQLESIDRKVKIDTNITEELRQAGLLRGIVRQIQSLRGEAEYDFAKRINLYIKTNSNMARAFISESAEQFKQKLLIDDIVFVDNEQENADVQREIKIDGETATVYLKKV